MRRLALIPLLLLAAPLAAQDHDGHTGPPPARLGRVVLANSCSPAAQRAFERGVALMHSFWYEEASRAFREAAQADSGCAMTHWGVASSYLHPLWPPPTASDIQQAAAAVARARALRPATHREGMYVEAIGAFWDSASTLSHPQRLRRWSDALGRLHQAHADDDEATAFYALSLLAVANSSPPDTTYARQREAAALLEPLFRRHPDHPGLAHYLIHAYDAAALAASGARAADRYATIAPAVPHARHMPSHIYVRLGRWDRVVTSNASSADAARQYEREQNLSGVWGQRLHALDYKMYGYLQLGMDRQAQALMDSTNAMTRLFPERDLVGEYALAAIPARFSLERAQWRQAAALNVREGIAPQAAAVTHFARAVGAARGGDTTNARAALAALTAIDEDLTRRQVPLWTNMVHAQRLAAESWFSLATGDTARALQLAREAADLEDRSEKHPATPGAPLPARELLGDMLLAVHHYPEAWRAYEASLAMQPRRARSLSGAAEAARLAGDAAEALRYRQQLRTLLARADASRRAVAVR